MSTQIITAPQFERNSQKGSNVTLVKALAESIHLTQLPYQGPAVFSGDPLRFNDWRASFQMLIDRKPIPVEEMCSKYIGGSVKGVVDCNFPFLTLVSV